MVKEVQIIVGPEDVTKFGIQCAKCEATVMVLPTSAWAFPDTCPSCHAPWRYNKAVEECRELL